MATQTIAPQIIGDEELQTASGGFWVAGAIAGVAAIGSGAYHLSAGKPVPRFSTLEMIIPYYASTAATNAVMKSSN